jgi:hypothetical protein
VIRADVRERRVNIHIIGGIESWRREFLAIVRDKIDEQRRYLKGLPVDERVPVPGELSVTVSYYHLLTLEEEGEEWCRPEGSRQKFRVQDLLNGFETNESRARRREQQRFNLSEGIMTKKHVFLSYCHENEAEVKQVHDYLVSAGETVWWDKLILPGHDWKLEIRKAMRNAYSVVLILSKESEARATSGIYPEALDAIGTFREYTPGSIFLIPIRLSDCDIPFIEIDGTRTLDRLQYVDLFPGTKRTDGLNRLLQALQATPNHP